ADGRRSTGERDHPCEGGNGDRRRWHRGPYAIILVFVHVRRVPLSILEFVTRNWPIALVFVISGALLLWPLAQGRLAPARDIGTLDATRLLNKENALVLDVREPGEVAGGRLPNATHIPLSQLKD